MIKAALHVLLTMSLHFANVMQLVCGVAGLYTKMGVASKLSLGQLSEFRAPAHAAAYAVEEWYRLYQ